MTAIAKGRKTMSVFVSDVGFFLVRSPKNPIFLKTFWKNWYKLTLPNQPTKAVTIPTVEYSLRTINRQSVEDHKGTTTMQHNSMGKF